MDVLDGFVPMERPEIKKYKHWNTYAILKTFVDTGEECRGKRYEDMQTAKKADVVFRSCAKRHAFPVRIVRSGQTLKLVKVVD